MLCSRTTNQCEEPQAEWRRPALGQRGSHKHSLGYLRVWPSRHGGLSSPCWSTVSPSICKDARVFRATKSLARGLFSTRRPPATGAMPGSASPPTVPSLCPLLDSLLQYPLLCPSQEKSEAWLSGRLWARGGRPKGLHLTIPGSVGTYTHHRKLPGWISHQLRKMAM